MQRLSGRLRSMSEANACRACAGRLQHFRFLLSAEQHRMILECPEIPSKRTKWSVFLRHHSPRMQCALLASGAELLYKTIAASKLCKDLLA